MEKKNSEMTQGTQGYTLVELITVLAIMGILGTMLVSMLNIGVKFYRNEYSAMDNQNNARLAIAYITVKIRQNDAYDISTGVAKVSVISKTDSSNIPIQVLQINDVGNSFFWIYFDRTNSTTGVLREQSGTEFDPVLVHGSAIADLRGVDIESNGTNIITIEAISLDGSVDLTQNITLRSSP